MEENLSKTLFIKYILVIFLEDRGRGRKVLINAARFLALSVIQRNVTKNGIKELSSKDTFWKLV